MAVYNQQPLMKPTAQVGIVLLAAGGSSRMGSPKQLLRLHGVSMVRKAATTALETGADPVVVVVGSHAEEVRRELEGLPVWVVENDSWEEGIASSIRAGIAALEQTEVEAGLIVLGDQPLITSADLGKIIAVAANHPGSMVASYGETIGAPALFPRQWFSHLQQLRGDQGARHLLMSNATLVRRVVLENAATDVDTQDAWADLEKTEEEKR